MLATPTQLMKQLNLKELIHSVIVDYLVYIKLCDKRTRREAVIDG